MSSATSSSAFTTCANTAHISSSSTVPSTAFESATTSTIKRTKDVNDSTSSNNNSVTGDGNHEAVPSSTSAYSIFDYPQLNGLAYYAQTQSVSSVPTNQQNSGQTAASLSNRLNIASSQSNLTALTPLLVDTSTYQFQPQYQNSEQYRPMPQHNSQQQAQAAFGLYETGVRSGQINKLSCLVDQNNVGAAECSTDRAARYTQLNGYMGIDATNGAPPSPSTASRPCFSGNQGFLGGNAEFGSNAVDPYNSCNLITAAAASCYFSSFQHALISPYSNSSQRISNPSELYPSDVSSQTPQNAPHSLTSSFNQLLPYASATPLGQFSVNYPQSPVVGSQSATRLDSHMYGQRSVIATQQNGAAGGYEFESGRAKGKIVLANQHSQVEADKASRSRKAAAKLSTSQRKIAKVEGNNRNSSRNAKSTATNKANNNANKSTEMASPSSQRASPTTPSADGENATSVTPALENTVDRVFIWNLDETLIVFHSLLTGAFAQKYQQDASHCLQLGLRMEEMVFQLADRHLFFSDLEECDQVNIDDISIDDTKQDLTNYDFSNDGFSTKTNGSQLAMTTTVATTTATAKSSSFVNIIEAPPRSGVKEETSLAVKAQSSFVGTAHRPMSNSRINSGHTAEWVKKQAFRYRRIREIYQQHRHDPSALLPEPLCGKWFELQSQIQAITNSWPSLALKTLESINARAPKKTNGSTADSSRGPVAQPTSVNVLVSTTQLVPALAKVLLYGLGRAFEANNIYSATKVSKQVCFERIAARFGKRATYIVIGGGRDEETAAKLMSWPFWRVSTPSDLAAMQHALELGYL